MTKDRTFAVTMVATVVVASVAAIVSYSHMQLLAQRAGEDWRSWLIPISVDGMIVAASMVLLSQRRHYFAWGTLVVGVVASLSANMAAARPEPAAVLVAGWAPLAFAASFHLLLAHRRAVRELVQRPAPASQPAPATTPTDALLDRGPEPTRPAPRPELRPATTVPTAWPQPVTAEESASPEPAPVRVVAPPRPRPAPPRPLEESSGSGPRTNAPTVDDVRPLIAAGLGRNQIAQRLGIGTGTARALIAQARTEGSRLAAVS